MHAFFVSELLQLRTFDFVELSAPHEGQCTRRQMPAMFENALTKESRRSVTRSKTQFLKRKINKDKIVHTSREACTGKIN